VKAHQKTGNNKLGYNKLLEQICSSERVGPDESGKPIAVNTEKTLFPTSMGGTQARQYIRNGTKLRKGSSRSTGLQFFKVGDLEGVGLDQGSHLSFSSFLRRTGLQRFQKVACARLEPCHGLWNFHLLYDSLSLHSQGRQTQKGVLNCICCPLGQLQSQPLKRHPRNRAIPWTRGYSY
jgi:hypothetical protein